MDPGSHLYPPRGASQYGDGFALGAVDSGVLPRTCHDARNCRLGPAGGSERRKTQRSFVHILVVPKSAKLIHTG